MISKLYLLFSLIFFFNDTATTEIYTLSLHDALPISFFGRCKVETISLSSSAIRSITVAKSSGWRSEEHTSELQSRLHLVCRLLLEKKKKTTQKNALQNNKQEDTRCAQ